MQREELATRIAARITVEAQTLRRNYQDSAPGIGHFVLDDVLPAQIATEIAATFPPYAALHPKRNLRESKAVSAQMDRFHRLLEDALFAFQDRRVVDLIGDVCGIGCTPDPQLYAGGISAMRAGDFLNPHLDNSHDGERDRWRVLNLLYYCRPGWTADNGGALELWPEGTSGPRIEIPPLFNRLVVMATHDRSWHSVAPVVRGVRRCISNYYFSAEPIHADEKPHITTFRARPGHIVTDMALMADNLARRAAGAVAPGCVQSRHRYAASPTRPVQDRMPAALIRPAIE